MEIVHPQIKSHINENHTFIKIFSAEVKNNKSSSIYLSHPYTKQADLSVWMIAYSTYMYMDLANYAFIYAWSFTTPKMRYREPFLSGF